MTQLKDVIHLYINSEVLYSVKYVDNAQYSVWAKLTEKRYRQLDDRSIEDVHYSFRRLEDMSEEEMRELYRARTLWAYIQGSHIKRIGFAEGNRNAINIDYSGPSGSSGYTYGNDIMYLNALMPNQFHYLLKQGFDLWNLIDSGQAIDAKTLNQKV